MALTVPQQAAYNSLVAQGRTEYANQFAAAMTAINAGVPVEQATQAAFSAPAPAQPAYFQQNPDVAAAYAENNYGMTPEQFAATHYQLYGANEQRAAPTENVVSISPSNQFDQLIKAAYGSIGRTGFGTGMNQIDQGGYDHWSNLLSTGQVKPEDFQNVFNNAVNEYVANNPTDQYTQYVQNYRASNPSNTTQATTQATNTVSDAALKNWIDSNPNATAGQLYTAALNQGVGLDQIQRVTGLSTQDLLKEQILSTSDSSQWSGEGWGSAEKNAADMAKILESVGITNVLDLGITSTDGGQTYYNKATGEEITMPSTYGERQTGNAFGGTFAGKGNTGYRVSLNEQGQPVFYTTGASSSDLGSIAPLLAIGGMIAAPWLSTQIGALTGLTGAGLSAATGATLGGATGLLTGGDLGDIAKGALLGGAGGYLTGGGLKDVLGSGDFAGMNSSLTPAQIDAGLGTPGYGYNAGAASSGYFDPSVIGSGAYTQTSYPYDMSEFLAADAQNLYSQVGSNIPAIEQNLVASGVDPLVAADVANQITLNPNISTYDLTNHINTNFGGGSLYDVNTATQYPTSTVTGTGGLLDGSAAPATTATTTPTTSTNTSSLTPAQISNLIKAGIGLLGTGAVANAVGGTGGVGALPTQGVPTGNQDYYNAIQQYYNAYMPAAPRDVATPLQNWYNSKYGA